MKIHASLTKKVKASTSTWHFCQSASKCFIISDDLKVIEKKDLEELRTAYSWYVSKGFTKVEPVAPPKKVA